jgi:hypothetical protein
MQAVTTIQTTNASRYLGQFCKHFAHKTAVDFDAGNKAGQVKFTPGLCDLRADDDTLVITVSGDTENDIAALKDVTARHLIRFAFREEITMDWRPA